MKRALITLIALSALLGSGCVSKKELDASEAKIVTCEEEKLKLEAAVIGWEQRFDRESTRWNEMEASISDALPRALGELDSEREKILELVPEQVQSEVEIYLQEYRIVMMQGFQTLQQDNADIKLRLEATHDALKAVGADTRAINKAIDENVAEERSKREQFSSELDTRVSEIVDQVVAFDQSRINCKECPDRLKLNRNQREVITRFHDELTTHLAGLRSFAGAQKAVVMEPVEAEGEAGEE